MTFIFYKIFCLFIHASTLLLIVFFAAFGSLGALGSFGALGTLGAFGSLGTTNGAVAEAEAGAVAEAEVEVEVDVDVDVEVELELELDVVIISPIEPRFVTDEDVEVTDFLGVFKEMRSFFGETNSPMI